MAILISLLFLITNFTIFQQVTANISTDGKLMKALIERIDRLEASDAANKREIASLQSEMRIMERTFLDKEEILVAEINELKSKLLADDLDKDVNERTQKSTDTHVEDDQAHDNGPPISSVLGQKHDVIKRSKGTNRSNRIRGAVEKEVAFYATHSQHDIQHLGQNQIIVFDQAVTNVGNAYNSKSGAFVAPVAGTYVFHVTVMAKDVHAVSYDHFSAHIDVDGTAYSQLWVAPYEQSSQMFVIELEAGKTVSVKNHVLDDGFVGQHMSTFSGFLLYEHYTSSVIVGK